MEHYQNFVPFTVDGQLTQEAVLFLAALVDLINAQQAEIDALDARVTALEP